MYMYMYPMLIMIVVSWLISSILVKDGAKLFFIEFDSKAFALFIAFARCREVQSSSDVLPYPVKFDSGRICLALAHAFVFTFEHLFLKS